MKHEDRLVREENRRVRLLRMCADLLVQYLMTRPVRTEQAQRMIRGLRGFALKLFPGKGEVFDLIYLPRFRRALREAGASETAALIDITRCKDPARDT